MIGFMLAAGLGTRLRPLTDQIPKCLIPIGGRPLMSYWLDLLVAHGVERVVINSHHLHEQMVTYVQSLDLPIRITLTYEPTLLGSAGTLRANRRFTDGEDDFLVVYADNLTNVNLSELFQQHRRSAKIATLALFRTAQPSRCGIVSLDSEGTVVEFHEKPTHPTSNLAFGGLMVASPAFLNFIPDRVPCDLGKDVLPLVLGQIAGWEVPGYLRDLGTLEDYQQAQTDLPQLQLERQ